MNSFTLEGTLLNVQSIPTKATPGARFLVEVKRGSYTDKLPVVAWEAVANSILTAGTDAHGRITGSVRRSKWTNKDGATVWETSLVAARYEPTRPGETGKGPIVSSDPDNLPF